MESNLHSMEVQQAIHRNQYNHLHEPCVPRRQDSHVLESPRRESEFCYPSHHPCQFTAQNCSNSGREKWACTFLRHWRYCGTHFNRLAHGNNFGHGFHSLFVTIHSSAFTVNANVLPNHLSLIGQENWLVVGWPYIIQYFSEGVAEVCGNLDPGNHCGWKFVTGKIL